MSESNILSKTIFSYGSGATHVCMQHDTTVIELILSVDTVNALRSKISSNKRKQAALTRVSTVLEKRSVILDAVLGVAEISISEMLNLSVGDVIRIEKSVTDPIDVTLDSTVLCHGVLGYHGGEKALQLKPLY